MQLFKIKDNQYNIAYYCTRYQCVNGNSKKLAFRFIGYKADRCDYSFEQLDKESNRYANVLTTLGIKPGDIIFTFLPKMPEQFFAFLGILKTQAVAGTLYSNFGEEALADRLGDSRAVAVITKKSLLKKLMRALPQLEHLKYILVVDGLDNDEKTLALPALLAKASDKFDVPITGPDTPSVLHYTSGSTGKPKGVQHVHKSILTQSYTAQHVLNIKEDDLYWCTADQGWVTGTSYGIIGPWALGVSQLHYGGAYNAETWMELLEHEGVTKWYTAPTALRMLMREDKNIFKRFSLNKLHYIFSVGEPLNPEINLWAAAVLGKEVYDTWFQTETGSIMICNRPGIKIKPGSMGKPIDIIEAAVLSEDGSLCPVGKTGHLCIKAPWDSMLRAYLNNEAAYNEKFRNGYYYTGDLAFCDEEAYYHFVGRNDDVINTAGHLISPFEVESTLLEIPEIAESAVIGAPDELLFEKVVAFIRLKDHVVWTDDLEVKIRLFLSNRLSSIATPQDIRLVEEVPKNKSGKIMRRVLRAWYMGEDPGDISTMEI
ncbi:MAG TPA: AMP-binding protein [Bacteroidales bacterium]|nr:AMP-binding protein [Bacteroidales bacterium]HPS26999.1 AMP-binding protein [Bacteroidales bacterium]